MSSPEQKPQVDSVETVTSELKLALDGFRTAAQILVAATEKAGEFLPEEVMQGSSRGEGTEYQELYNLWVLSPGDEVLGLLGAQE